MLEYLIRYMKTIRSDSRQNKAWKILLAEKNMSAKDVTVKAEIPYTTFVNAMKRDIGRMEIATAEKVSDALGMTINEMIDYIRYK